MSRARRFVIAALAASALTLATATASHAATSTNSSSNSCGAVYFYGYGDIFKFLDVCSDGKGVRLQYTSPTTGTPSTSHTKIHVDYTGGYTGWDLNDAFVYNTDMNESACFYYRVGHVDNGAYVSGSYGGWTMACAGN